MNAAVERTICDPVHGNISLTKLEDAVVDTRAFQRLRHVGQLGLVSLVFPGADFSRFSHSLGVCHITGRFIRQLRERGLPVEDDDERDLRLAALLHDVGHYPFSHTTEHAVLDYCSERNVESEEGLVTPASHEKVSGLLISGDSQLSGLLESEGVDAESLVSLSNEPSHRSSRTSSVLI